MMLPLFEQYRPKTFGEVCGQEEAIAKINTLRHRGLGGRGQSQDGFAHGCRGGDSTGEWGGEEYENGGRDWYHEGGGSVGGGDSGWLAAGNGRGVHGGGNGGGVWARGGGCSDSRGGAAGGARGDGGWGGGAFDGSFAPAPFVQGYASDSRIAPVYSTPGRETTFWRVETTNQRRVVEAFRASNRRAEREARAHELEVELQLIERDRVQNHCMHFGR